jgi:hypothetical protein
MPKFEWNKAKAEKNWRTHGISFEGSTTAFNDPFAIDFADDRKDYGEMRFVIIGMAERQQLLYVVYTEREERIRIISARKATRNEENQYYCRKS